MATIRLITEDDHMFLNIAEGEQEKTLGEILQDAGIQTKAGNALKIQNGLSVFSLPLNSIIKEDMTVRWVKNQ